MGNEPDPIEALAQAADALRKMIELAAGHKVSAMEAGFSEEHAEQMAVHFHAELVSLAMRS